MSDVKPPDSSGPPSPPPVPPARPLVPGPPQSVKPPIKDSLINRGFGAALILGLVILVALIILFAVIATGLIKGGRGPFAWAG